MSDDGVMRCVRCYCVSGSDGNYARCGNTYDGMYLDNIYGVAYSPDEETNCPPQKSSIQCHDRNSFVLFILN